MAAEIKLSPALKKMRERGLNDLHYFVSEILGYGREPYNLNVQIHKEAADWLQETFTQPCMFSVWNDFRGCGKSKQGGVGHTLWRAVRNPNITIRYIHADEKLGGEIMGDIRGHLESNEILRTLYSDRIYMNVSESPFWSDDVVTLRRTFSPRTPTLRMLGYRTGRIGTHVDMFVLDDLVNDKTSATGLLLESVKDFVRRLPPLLNSQSKSRILCLGTRWDINDAWGMLTEGPEYEGIVRKKVHSVFTDATETASRWPEKLSIEDLRRMEVSMTPFYFSANMRNDPIPKGSQIFDVSKVKKYELKLDARMRPDLPSEQPYLVYTAIDPNHQEGEQYDAGVVMTVARDGLGNHFVLDIEYGRPNSIELVLWIRRAVENWRPTAVFYEHTSGQKLLLPWLKRDMVDSGVVYPLHKSTRPVNQSKEVRIRALANVIETGRLWVPESVRFKPLLAEIERYTGAKKLAKDDCLDCLADIYCDGFDPTTKKVATQINSRAPWQSSLLDGMIESTYGGTWRPRKVTCSERVIRR